MVVSMVVTWHSKRMAVGLCLVSVILALSATRTTSAAHFNSSDGTLGTLSRRSLQAYTKRGDGFWSVRGAQFVDSRGLIVRFSGVMWSGFETPDAFPHGIEKRSYQSHLDQMRSLGFNMIRLTFAGETLKPTTFPAVPSVSLFNPDLRGLNSLQIMDKIIQAAGQRGIKIILAYHRMRLTIRNEVGTWFDDGVIPESVWLNNWAMLARRYKGNPTVVGADLFNEVHPNVKFPKNAPYWVYNAGVNEKYNFRTATLRAMRRIHAVEPNWIIFMEGMWQGGWWGGNVVELQKAPINQPANKIAYSTHEYGPMVYLQGYFKDASFPVNLIPRFRKKWGIIQERNIRPVWVGEFGSFFPPPTTDLNRRERTAFLTLISYMKALKCSWTLAFWNPNSKDTGGILNEDWITVNQAKMNALKPIMYPNFI